MRMLLALWAATACAQTFTQRGFLEMRFTGFPQTAVNDSGRAVGEMLFRYEASARLANGLRFNGGFDARTDTHRQDEREPWLSWADRELRRPAFEVRRASVAYDRAGFTIELGKQFIRWGKADVLNPTDRFAPRDFLSVTDNEFLAITAARATYEHGGHTLDAVWQPLFTPSRTPLLNQRWVPLPPLPIADAGARYPGGSQAGLRWNRVASGFEYSLSFFDGFNNLPLFEVTPPLRVTRFYPRMRMYGGDAAVPLKLFTVKAEAAYFTSHDDYGLYVIQLERQHGEWMFVGGYAGQFVTRHAAGPNFAPDRGLARAFLGRASYTIDTNRSLAFEGAVRQNGKGTWLKGEYSQAFGQHWRATAGATLIRGDTADFLGQYRRNSHFTLALRYSF